MEKLIKVKQLNLAQKFVKEMNIIKTSPLDIQWPNKKSLKLDVSLNLTFFNSMNPFLNDHK